MTSFVYTFAVASLKIVGPEICRGLLELNVLLGLDYLLLQMTRRRPPGLFRITSMIVADYFQD